MAYIPWSLVCDDGSSAQGVVGHMTLNLLALKLTGMLLEAEYAGVALADEAARSHHEKFVGAGVTIDFTVDIVTSRLGVKSIEVATRFSEGEEERLRQALARRLSALETLQDLTDLLAAED